MKVYMEITLDCLELPVVVSGSVRELAKICKISENAISSGITKARKGSTDRDLCAWRLMMMEKKTYKCSKVGKTCFYAGKFGAYFCCDYLVTEGHSRGCKPEECDKYIKRKRGSRKVRPEL